MLVNVNTYKFDAFHFLSYSVINSKKYCQKQLFLLRSKNHELVFVCFKFYGFGMPLTLVVSQQTFWQMLKPSSISH